MIESLLVWFLGPHLAGGALVVGVIGCGAFTVSRIIMAAIEWEDRRHERRYR